ncbi:hypothetical protein [Cupriavidus gilardii]|uniref:hypothetical protein n=1 Tax=Cupriavidus gilardii TaxID=82541 RepID=UPI001574D810|nr:hypothetical protein [Cupriavidus gilardii]NSX02284.1 hypothetical protein [Cupriavidus gilardii]
MATKEVGIRIRVEKELRDEFQSACLAENRRASEVLREFMRVYARHRMGGRQSDLFPSGDHHAPKDSNE